MTTATKYKTYPKYKPSGIDWLGDIPDNWETNRLRYFFDYHAGGVWGDEEKGDQNDLICLRVADFDFDHFGLSNNDLTNRNIPENQHSRILEKGDILLEKSGGGEKQTVGRAVRFDSNDRAVCSNFIEKLTPHKIHNSKYISYLMGALYYGTINVRSIKQTTGIQNLDIYAYFCEVVPFPEKSIQQSIADFLDRETAKIDEMVAKKQKMIELLREKRQALITHAVTKGLSSFAKASADKDPKAKMKPSGIDWLGDIPEGWEAEYMKNIGCFTSSGIDKKIVEGEPLVQMVNYTDIYGNEARVVNKNRDLMTVSCPAWKIQESNLIKGDLVFTPSSETTEDIGLSALIDDDLINTVFSYHVIRFRFSEDFDHDFKKYWCNNSFVWQQFSSLAKGTTRQILDRNDFKNIFVVIPPKTEQQSIADFLDRETAKIDEMVKKTELQIEKLQEYRQALITSAVTGKIMVN